MRAGARRDRHHARDRLDLQRRADGEQQVGLGGGRHRPVDHLGHERLAERDRVALQDAAAVAAMRIVFAGAHARERLFHRRAPAALPAHDAAHAAVHLDDLLGRLAGALVQLVDVLRDERVQHAAPLERDEGAMAGVRLGRPGRANRGATRQAALLTSGSAR